MSGSNTVGQLGVGGQDNVWEPQPIQVRLTVLTHIHLAVFFEQMQGPEPTPLQQVSVVSGRLTPF